MSKIVVIGSANMDTTHYLRGDFPEECTQESLNEIERTARVLGGKGANQARATKLQSKSDKIYFIGCIGKDEAGLSILEEFKKVNLNFSGVKVLDKTATDGRIIYVNKNGDNRMMGYGDCVKQLTPDMIDPKILEAADIVAIQMKMPPETSRFVIEYCRKHNKPLIIDPTPPEKASILAEDNGELLKQATYLTPNEEEAFALVKFLEGKTSMKEINEEFKRTPKEKRLKMIEGLVERYPNIVATIGGDGVIYNKGKVIRRATFPTVCRDSTGAGDTFNGAFIASLARGENIDKAVEYGLMASSIKVQFLGAQNGVPTYEETKKAIDKSRRTFGTKDDDDGNR